MSVFKQCLRKLHTPWPAASARATIPVQTQSKLLFSTAFDPSTYLHTDTVNADQQEVFRDVWKNDVGDFKHLLTDDEIALFDDKVSQTTKLEDFSVKITGLWGPTRHEWVRKTRTWRSAAEYIRTLTQQSKDANALLVDIIFGTDADFNECVYNQLIAQDSQSEKLFVDFIYGDFRFMCACIAVSLYGGPDFLAVFGCRNAYHHLYPSALGHSAYWMNCMYDRCTVHDIVLVSCLSAIRESKQISPQYFTEKLKSLDHNAYKETEWREYAEEFATMEGNAFFDRLDRAFLAFQTDEGVTDLLPNFNEELVRGITSFH